jgi:endonuclease/exonuclease/phosphatase family metal-dependent hydrolase
VVLISLYHLKIKRQKINIMGLKVVTLNMEADKHLGPVLRKLKILQPHVICLQEIFEKDLEEVSRTLDMNYYFAKNLNRQSRVIKDQNYYSEGIAIFSRLEFKKTLFGYYHSGNLVSDLPFDTTSIETMRITESRAVIGITVYDKKREEYMIANTHFTWTPDGKVNEYQEQDLKSLMEFIGKFPHYILCGDFNIPRGKNPLYGHMRDYGLIDHIPQHVISSIDCRLHKKAHADPHVRNVLSETMVDYIFSTKDYKTSKFSVHTGMSDHKLFSVNVERIGQLKKEE